MRQTRKLPTQTRRPPVREGSVNSVSRGMRGVHRDLNPPRNASSRASRLPRLPSDSTQAKRGLERLGEATERLEEQQSCDGVRLRACSATPSWRRSCGSRSASVANAGATQSDEDGAIRRSGIRQNAVLRTAEGASDRPLTAAKPSRIAKANPNSRRRASRGPAIGRSSSGLGSPPAPTKQICFSLRTSKSKSWKFGELF